MRAFKCCVFCLACCCLGVARGQEGPAGDALPIQFSLEAGQLQKAKVQAVTPEGRMEVLAEKAEGRRHNTAFIEGHYLALIMSGSANGLIGARLFRAQVLEVEAEGLVQVQVGPAAAAKVQPGEAVFFFRPLGSTTAQLKLVPDFTVLEVPDGPAAAAVTARVQSLNNLMLIGLALHNFHDVYKGLPPAVLYGPDGKPWHSWRVLILPYLDQVDLYETYHFDEPWDGPNNKLLLKRMPGVYRDPVYPESDEFHTHYAAITGPHTVFPNMATKLQGDPAEQDAWIGQVRATKLSFSKVTDGLSNTVAVATVGPDAEIPWMKPADVTLVDEFPALGQPGSFAAAHQSAAKSAGLFLFCDGSVHAITGEIGPETWRRLLMADDGYVIERAAIPTLDPPARAELAAPVIEIVPGPEGTQVRLLLEAAE